MTGWFSFLHGEATAGDVLALERVETVLRDAGQTYDVVWSPGFRADGTHFEDVDPAAYTHLVFVCGPAHGPQVEELHRRFAHCVRIAVGVSVVDPASPAVTGFHHVLTRDTPTAEPTTDLAARAPAPTAPPVVGVILTHGQREYGGRRRHAEVAEAVTAWLGGKDCARLELETRLDTHDWRLCATPAQLETVLARLDLVVTDRLHGLVLALRAGIPALAVDPVAGGAKVTAQAHACGWPALVTSAKPAPHDLGTGALGTGALGTEKLTPGKLTARELTARELEAGERTTRELASEKPETCESRTGELGTGELGAGELGTGELGTSELERWWAWCLGDDGREAARRIGTAFRTDGVADAADRLVEALGIR